jgi:hypothetical protein
MNSRDTTTTRPAAGKTADTPKLRKPQVRILRVLADGRARTRQQIVKDAEVERAWCTEYLGSSNADIRAKNDALRFPSLLTLDLIRSETIDANGKDLVVFEITSKGRRAVANLT